MIHVGDNRDILPTIPDASIDAIVTDPPYELGFMGKTWDSTGIAYNVEMWRECLRVLKPGGHLLAFGGSRTYHRLACAIEDAGFEIRDQIMWVYGSGFPKSLNVSKAIDKMIGAEREAGGVGISRKSRNVLNAANYPDTFGGEYEITVASSDAAKQWEGWGTALKPAHEPIVLARKPLNGTLAANVLQHGTGAINIEACRIAANDGYEKAWDRPVSTNIGAGGKGNYISDGSQHQIDISANKPSGRWPANLIHDGSNEVLELFPDATGDSAARFFYCAKANKRDRNEGLDNLQPKIVNEITVPGTKGSQSPRAGAGRTGAIPNHHPTVKPTDLMRYLCRLITPLGGLILDPFTGSGSTGKAAILEGFRFIGIEQNAEYAHIAETRIHSATQQQ